MTTPDTTLYQGPDWSKRRAPALYTGSIAFQVLLWLNIPLSLFALFGSTANNSAVGASAAGISFILSLGFLAVIWCLESILAAIVASPAATAAALRASTPKRVAKVEDPLVVGVGSSRAIRVEGGSE